MQSSAEGRYGSEGRIHARGRKNAVQRSCRGHHGPETREDRVRTRPGVFLQSGLCIMGAVCGCAERLGGLRWAADTGGVG